MFVVVLQRFMAKRGKKQLPTAIVKQRGFYKPSRHKDHIGENNAIEFVHNGIPTAPEHFDDKAVEIWQTILMQAQNVKGYISFLDLPLFEQYCECYSELHYLNNLCRGNKYYYEDDKGVKRINPLYQEKDKKRKTLISLAREFGFTPSSRTGLKLTQETKKEKFDEFEEGL